MFLSQTSIPVLGFIIDPIAKLMGYIMDIIFQLLSSVGIVNLGLCIIIFTFIIMLAMMPMTIKQLKFSKMSALVQPEILKIQKKYKGKQDQASMLKQNEEIHAVYDKYGISMTGGCLQMFIQLPILMALYQVIRNLPFYIPHLHDLYEKIAVPLMATPGYEKIITGLGTAAKVTYPLAEHPGVEEVIGYISQFRIDTWAGLADKIPSISDVVTNVSAKIIEMNNFMAGINITESPGFRISVYLIIPVAAAFFQWLSMKTMMAPTDDKNNPAASMTKSMNMMMPLMSFVMCFSFPAGIGIYWGASAFFRVIQQIFINRHMAKMDMEELIAKNLEKAAKKKKKKKPSLTERMLGGGDQGDIASHGGTITSAANANTRKYNSENTSAGNSSAGQTPSHSGTAKPGSLAEKAGLVQNYNEHHK